MTQDPASAELFSERPAVEVHGSVAETRLGGIVVYAMSEEQLVYGLKKWTEAIISGVRAHASLDRKMLLSVAARALGRRLDPRVFDAVLGSVLRTGRIDRIPCASESNKVFRVLISAERLQEFEERCRKVNEWLREEGKIGIRQIRDKYFGRGWGTWSSASHLACRLVLVGRAQHVDRYTIAWPSGLQDAVR